MKKKNCCFSLEKLIEMLKAIEEHNASVFNNSFFFGKIENLSLSEKYFDRNIIELLSMSILLHLSKKKSVFLNFKLFLFIKHYL